MEDKTMKKVFGIAAMLLALAACNKIETNVQPVENNEGIPFSATISVGNNATTKALAESGSTIVATWAVDETVALIHNGVKDEMTVSAVNEGVATITGTITGSPSDGDAVTVIYPASAADGATGKIKADLLHAQNGLLTGVGSIAANYDARKGTGTLKVNGTTASLNGNMTLTNQFAIFKFTVKNSNASATINVKLLTITIGAQNYVITPALATSELYVALPAVSDQAVRFSATGSDSKTYTCSKASVTFAAGKYYQSMLKMAPPITVTWNNNDITGSGNSFTKDGVTITAGSIDFDEKNFEENGTFTTTLGNFTKIEVVATNGFCDVSGTGWSGNSDKRTWTGNASSVSFIGDIYGDGNGIKFVFTIEP